MCQQQPFLFGNPERTSLLCCELLKGATTMDLISSIVGVWKYVSFIDKEVESGNVLKPFGENPSGYIV